MTSHPDRAVDVPRRGLPARMLGAALGWRDVYREIGVHGAVGQAAIVVVLASGAATMQDYGLNWFPLLERVVVDLLQWPMWAGVAYLMCRRGREVAARKGTETVSPESGRHRPAGEWKRVLAVVGFARTPGILFALSPVIGGIQFAAHVWILAVGVIGIREGLEVGTWRALFASLLGVLPYWTVLALYVH